MTSSASIPASGDPGPTAAACTSKATCRTPRAPCLWSWICCVRILMEIASFDARDERALYEGTRHIGWAEWVTPRTTLAVRASCRSSRLTHSQFVAQKTKDAIVDVIRESAGARPSVDRDDPDVAVSLRLARDCATVYLDVGGASLHERGWRTRSGVAPAPRGRSPPRCSACRDGIGKAVSSIRCAGAAPSRSRQRRGRATWRRVFPGPDSDSSDGRATTT